MIETENGRSYLKFDRITVAQVRPGELVVTYALGSEPVYSIVVSCDLRAGQMLNLVGVEGRMEVLRS